MAFLPHLVMEISEMIKVALSPDSKYQITKKANKDIYYVWIDKINYLLEELESSELALFDNNYVLELKNHLVSLKNTWQAFKRTTNNGKGPISAVKKISQIQAWLEQYGNQTSDPMADSLLNDFVRIDKIFQSTLPEKYAELETRIDAVMEFGSIFVKKINAFLLSEDDVDMEGVLMADDSEELDIPLKRDVPKKVLASMISARNIYRKFFERVNEQIKSLHSDLEILEAVDFPAIMEQFNTRNKKIQELISAFQALSKNLKHNMASRGNLKINYLEQFEPGWFDYYRDLLRRCAKFLPEGMAEHLQRQVDPAALKMKTIMQNSLEPSRKEKFDPNDAIEELAKADKAKKTAQLTPIEILRLQTAFSSGLNKIA